MSRTSITSGQKKQYRRFIEDAAHHGADLALDKVPLNCDGMQLVLGHGDEIRTAVAEVIVAKTREFSVSNQYANEEVSSNYGYLSGYREAKPLANQLATLRQYFPQLKDANERIATQERPANSEGWFAIPRWRLIAPTYGKAVQAVLDALRQHRGEPKNYLKELGPDRLRGTDQKRLAFERLGQEQTGHDILVVAAQFGILHRGRSFRRARVVMSGGEFGLGAFEILIMLLTHPERLANYNDLWIDCAGDKYFPDAGGRFGLAPCVRFCDGRLGFGARWFDDASDYYGSASGFSLPACNA